MFCNTLICEIPEKDAPFFFLHFNFMVKKKVDEYQCFRYAKCAAGQDD
jgi:hypothetical protein